MNIETRDTPRILVVDDEPQVHRFFKPALEVSGYMVTAAQIYQD